MAAKTPKKVSRIWAYLFFISLSLNTLFLAVADFAEDEGNKYIDTIISQPLEAALLLHTDAIHEWVSYEKRQYAEKYDAPFQRTANRLRGVHHYLTQENFDINGFIEFTEQQNKLFHTVQNKRMESFADFWSQVPLEKRKEYLRFHNGEECYFEKYITNARHGAEERVKNDQESYEKTHPIPITKTQ